MQLTLQIDGLEHFAAIGPKFERGSRRGVLAAAATYTEMVHDWIDSGQSFASQSGELQQSTGWRPDGAGAVVYAEAEHAEYIEDGTKPHVIKPAHRKTLRFSGDGAYVFARVVQHPGTEPRPFFFADMANRERAMKDAFVRETLMHVAGQDR